jgi:putative ABC transport system permease protein
MVFFGTGIAAPLAMLGLLRDVRFALRMMAKDPGFTVVAALTLALGIGASTATFSVVNAVLISPLPYPRSDQLVELYTQFPNQKLDRFWFSSPEYVDLARQASSYSSVGAYELAGTSLVGGDHPVRGVTAYSTASLFRTLGVDAALGRVWTEAEDTRDDPTVVVLGWSLWQSAFHGDPRVVGMHIIADAIPVTIVGVMPRGFDFPGNGVDLWVPAPIDPKPERRGGHGLSVIGRLKPGVSLADARREMQALTKSWSEVGTGHRIDAANHPIVIHPLQDEVVGHVRWMLWLLQGAVLFVLLIACANISNLLLARAEARGREIAIRTALGAGRARLVRQFLTESVILGLVGGALGLLFAIWGTDLLTSLIPPTAPRAHEIRVNAAVLGFGIGCSILAGVLFGLAPIHHTRVVDLDSVLREGARGSGGPARQRFRRALVIAEIGMAVVLVTGCGLMIKSFARLTRSDPGFRPEGLLTAQLEIPTKRYSTPEAMMGYWQRVSERLAALPGATGATVMTGLPPNRPINANDIRFEDKTPSRDGPVWNVDYWQTVGPTYFDTMGVRLVAGRFLDGRDVEGAPPAVMINEAFARKFYPGEDPVGKRVAVTGRTPPVWETIVGVVADVKQQGLEARAGTEVYIPVLQTKTITGRPPFFMNVVVRAARDPRALAGTVTSTISALDPDIPVAKLRTMDEIMWEAVARPRFVMLLLGGFAVLALLLAAIGIYGVMSYSVAQRSHELGIRMALGARAQAVLRLVMRQGLVLIVGGIVTGVAGALVVNAALSRVLGSMLFEVKALDPTTFLAVAAVVAAVATTACLVPARRATRVDPMVALRSE